MQKKFLNFKDDCIKYVNDNNFNELLNYVEFDLSDDRFTIDLFFYCKDIVILKHVIDNAINLECYVFAGRTHKLIHVICEYSIPEIIEYIISKKVNLECITNRYICKIRPVHIICQWSTFDMIRYIIGEDVKLDFSGNLKLKKHIKMNEKISKDEQNKLIKFIKILNYITDDYNNLEEDYKEFVIEKLKIKLKTN